LFIHFFSLQMDIANEISDAISNPLGGAVADDDELMEELEELEGEEMFSTMMNAPSVPMGGEAASAPAASVPAMPDVPMGEPEVFDTVLCCFERNFMLFLLVQGGDLDAEEARALAELEAAM
jgi:hypothetical protein